MDTLFIPNEGDFRRWIREAVKECLEDLLKNDAAIDENGQELLSREQIAEYLDISLVTLTQWMKGGLPFHKPDRKVYFIKGEVLDYIKKNKIKKGKHKSV